MWFFFVVLTVKRKINITKYLIQMKKKTKKEKKSFTDMLRKIMYKNITYVCYLFIKEYY